MNAPTSLARSAQTTRSYLPSSLTAAQWALAQQPVVAAVRASSTPDAEFSKGTASRLCRMLSSHPRWDRVSTPDLTLLITEPAISAHLHHLTASGASAALVAAHRSSLRRIARVLAGTPRVARRRVAQRTTPVALSSDSALLLSWLAASQPVLPTISAWEQLTGRQAANTLSPVVAALCAAGAPCLTPGTLAALSAVRAPTGIVSPRSWTAETPVDMTAIRPGKPLSRAAGLRLARAAHAALTAPTITLAPDPDLLPAVVREAIATYRPAGMAELRWEQLGPLCRRLVVGCNRSRT